MALQEAINRGPADGVWQRQPASFFSQTARHRRRRHRSCPPTAQAKEGMDISYNGIWGYSALAGLARQHQRAAVSWPCTAPTGPPTRASVALYDRAIALCRQAGFTDILLRGDTDFSLTAEFDRWDDDGVRFVFGYDAKANLVEARRGPGRRALPRAGRPAPSEPARHAAPQRARTNVKDDDRSPARLQGAAPEGRGRRRVLLPARASASATTGSSPCARTSRSSAARTCCSTSTATSSTSPTTGSMTADEVVAEARQRCNQENLIAQLKGGVRALHAPVNTLVANWAYMTMAVPRLEPQGLVRPAAARLAPLGRAARTSNAGDCSRWSSAPSWPLSSRSPARSSRPPARSAGASWPGTPGWALLPPPRRPLTPSETRPHARAGPPAPRQPPKNPGPIDTGELDARHPGAKRSPTNDKRPRRYQSLRKPRSSPPAQPHALVLGTRRRVTAPRWPRAGVDEAPLTRAASPAGG